MSATTSKLSLRTVPSVLPVIETQVSRAPEKTAIRCVRPKTFFVPDSQAETECPGRQAGSFPVPEKHILEISYALFWQRCLSLSQFFREFFAKDSQRTRQPVVCLAINDSGVALAHLQVAVLMSGGVLVHLDPKDPRRFGMIDICRPDVVVWRREEDATGAAIVRGRRGGGGRAAPLPRGETTGEEVPTYLDVDARGDAWCPPPTTNFLLLADVLHHATRTLPASDSEKSSLFRDFNCNISEAVAEKGSAAGEDHMIGDHKSLNKNSPWIISLSSSSFSPPNADAHADAHGADVNTDPSPSLLPPVSEPGSSENYYSHIYFTSGSTGYPKGCLLPHSAVVCYSRAKNHSQNVKRNSVVLLCSSATFDPCLGDLLATLCTGATVVVPWENNVRSFLEGVSDGDYDHVGRGERGEESTDVVRRGDGAVDVDVGRGRGGRDHIKGGETGGRGGVSGIERRTLESAVLRPCGVTHCQTTPSFWKVAVGEDRSGKRRGVVTTITPVQRPAMIPPELGDDRESPVERRPTPQFLLPVDSDSDHLLVPADTSDPRSDHDDAPYKLSVLALGGEALSRFWPIPGPWQTLVNTYGVTECYCYQTLQLVECAEDCSFLGEALLGNGVSLWRLPDVEEGAPSSSPFVRYSPLPEGVEIREEGVVGEIVLSGDQLGEYFVAAERRRGCSGGGRAGSMSTLQDENLDEGDEELEDSLSFSRRICF